LPNPIWSQRQCENKVGYEIPQCRVLHTLEYRTAYTTGFALASPVANAIAVRSADSGIYLSAGPTGSINPRKTLSISIHRLPFTVFEFRFAF
jgi:hypothetical protein